VPAGQDVLCGVQPPGSAVESKEGVVPGEKVPGAHGAQ